MERTAPQRPRWAAEIADETWERIEELIQAGETCTEIVRQCSVPAGKLRSLQLYAEKFAVRRRLKVFSRFKDDLLSAAEALGPGFMAAMTTIARNAVNPEMSPKRQEKACELMTEFTKTIARVMKGDEAAERERTARQEGTVEGLNVNDVVAQVLKEYER